MNEKSNQDRLSPDSSGPPDKSGVAKALEGYFRGRNSKRVMRRLVHSRQRYLFDGSNVKGMGLWLAYQFNSRRFSLNELGLVMKEKRQS